MMSESKVHCTQCGAEILAGGICMPCKNGGGAPEWARRRLWLKHCADPLANLPWYRSPSGNEIVTICQKLVTGELRCIEGARRMTELSAIVLDAAHGEKWLHKDWEVFFQVLESKGTPREVENTFMRQVRGVALKLLKEAGVSHDNAGK